MNKQLDLTWVDPRFDALQRHDESGPGTGLSRAIASRLGIDVSLVRVVFVLLALSSGLGAALYLWGTALTPNSSGARPIDSTFPGFRDWSPRTQKVAVVVSSLTLVFLLANLTPLPWGAGVIILLLLWMGAHGKLSRFKPNTVASRPAVAASDEDLVAQWRREMAAAIGPHTMAEPLPVVDLYIPAEPRAARVPAERPKSAWLVSLAIMAAGIAAGFGTLVAAGVVIVGAGAAMATVALLTLVYALAVRSRRIPRLLILLLAATMVPAGWLATQAASTAAVVASEVPAGSVIAHRVVADERTIVITEADLEGISQIRLDVVASDVTVELPGRPRSVIDSQRMSNVTYSPTTTDRPTLDVELVLNATASDVEVKYP